MAISTSVASASDLVDISVEIDGWTMLPIADAGVTTHIIATRNDDEILSTDIDVVLYEKTATGWSGSAYDPSVTKEDAMVDIAAEFGLTDPMAGDWLIDLDTDDVIDHIVPRVPFGKGFFVTDPLYVIASHMDDPEPLAESAESAGLASGSGAINTGGVLSGGSVGSGSDAGGGQSADGCGCDDACIQTMIAIGANVFLAGGQLSLDDADLAMTQYTQALFPCCRRRTTSTNISTPWTCGAWLSNPPVPIFGTQGAYSCSYSRTSARTQTKTSIRTCSDCTRCTWTETRTQRGTQTHTASILVTPPTTPSCPNPPTGAPACGGTVDSSNPWQPGSGLPCC